MGKTTSTLSVSNEARVSLLGKGLFPTVMTFSVMVTASVIGAPAERTVFRY